MYDQKYGIKEDSVNNDRRYYTMSKGADILERQCLQTGKVFIKAGEETARAYIIQSGEVVCFTMDGDRRIEVERLGPGTIIGEKYLVADEPAKLSYEVLETATVITVTRQDFQKRLAKADKSIKTVLEYAIQKLSYYENLETAKALKRSEIDDMAYALVRGLIADLPDEKKNRYEDAILPHINGLIKDIKTLKKNTA